MKYYNYPQPRGTEVAEDLDSKNVNDYVGGGSGGGAFIVGTHEKEITIQGRTVTTFECDKTFKEIDDAIMAGKNAVVVLPDGNVNFHSSIVNTMADTVDPEHTSYAFNVYVYNYIQTFTCTEENSYPVMVVQV